MATTTRFRAPDWFDTVAKAELHLHLEGAIPLPTLWDLVQRHGGDPHIRDRTALRRKFSFKNFQQFVAAWVWKNRFIRSHDDFTTIAAAVARDLLRQNIRRAEIFYSPPDFIDRGMTLAGITRAIRAGFSQVSEVHINLICDLVRDFGPERAAITLDALEEVRDQGVIGVGLGGRESEHPARLFADVLGKARERGWHVTAHAGETAGPTSIWEALNCGVERIGHGIRAIEDERLVDELVRRRIPLEICPTSNLRTGVVARIEDHPITKLRERGVIITINTDDPLMFGCSLAGELRLLEQRLEWNRAQIEMVVQAGFSHQWRQT